MATQTARANARSPRTCSWAPTATCGSRTWASQRCGQQPAIGPISRTGDLRSRRVCLCACALRAHGHESCRPESLLRARRGCTCTQPFFLHMHFHLQFHSSYCIGTFHLSARWSRAAPTPCAVRPTIWRPRSSPARWGRLLGLLGWLGRLDCRICSRGTAAPPHGHRTSPLPPHSSRHAPLASPRPRSLSCAPCGAPVA